ncbi:MAG: hypothetical protein DNFNHJIP_00394 [Candidatus Argoarchaeum ethanivorans]|uniref:Uncharacterized protein n=1 Tax=Candidatus Argoarchaeum ethanivorans TaxID=2608793 RepID=A0A812A232_9EURY|nr:MAG: hypothetical protein DNFNHJIP_00394 [Candidatus Argoarchaeum ethanivorans]
MKLKDCFEKGLLRKVKIHEEVAVKEINATKFIEKIENKLKSAQTKEEGR